MPRSRAIVVSDSARVGKGTSKKERFKKVRKKGRKEGMMEKGGRGGREDMEEMIRERERGI